MAMALTNKRMLGDPGLDLENALGANSTLDMGGLASPEMSTQPSALGGPVDLESALRASSMTGAPPPDSDSGPATGGDPTTPAGVIGGASFGLTTIPVAGSKAVDKLMGTGPSAPNQTEIARAAVAPSNANAQTLVGEALQQEQLAQNYRGPSSVVGSVVSGPTLLDASQYKDTTEHKGYAYDATGRMQGYDAALATAADSTNRQTQANVTQAQGVGDATVAGVDTSVKVPTIGDAALANRVGVERVQTSGLADALRAEQIQAARAISSAPSAAMAQFQAGQSQVVSDQLAMAASARGAEAAGARREAMIAAGQQGATANLQASALAAKEEQEKRAASVAALSGIRSQDVTSANQAAQLQAEQANLQAQLDVAVAQGNASAVNDIKKKQADLALSARQTEISGGISQQSTLASLAAQNQKTAQETALFNAGASNKSASDYAAAVNAASNQNAQNQTTVSLANAGAQTGAAKDFASAANASAQNFAAAQTATSQQNAELAAKQASENAGRGLSADTTNQSQTQAAKTASAANTQAASTANASNELAAQQLRQGGAVSAVNAGTSAAGVQAENARTVTDANKSAADDQTKKDAALIGGLATAGAAALSDERAKQDVKKIPDSQLLDLADHMNAYTFRYKPGFEDGGEGEHASELAQELERSALGKKLVTEDADGYKHIKPLELAAVMAAAAAASTRKREAARA